MKAEALLGSVLRGGNIVGWKFIYHSNIGRHELNIDGIMLAVLETKEEIIKQNFEANKTAFLIDRIKYVRD